MLPSPPKGKQSLPPHLPLPPRGRDSVLIGMDSPLNVFLTFLVLMLQVLFLFLPVLDCCNSHALALWVTVGSAFPVVVKREDLMQQ